MFAAVATTFALSGCANLQNLTPDLPITQVLTTGADPALTGTAMERAKLAIVPFEETSSEWEKVTTAHDMMGRSRSGFDAALFRSGENYAFVFYGYNELKDVGEVVKVGFMGIPKKQLEEAHDFVTRASEVHGFSPSQADFVGHSLGGYLAKAVALHTGAQNVWVYNSPGFKRRDPGRFERLFGDDDHGPYNEPAIYNISSDEDVVGRWGYQPGEVYELDTGKRHHAIAAMIAALRDINPFAQDDPPLAAEARLKKDRPGFLGRLFNRISQSDFVQKRIARKFRSPDQPEAEETNIAIQEQTPQESRAPAAPRPPDIG